MTWVMELGVLTNLVLNILISASLFSCLSKGENPCNNKQYRRLCGNWQVFHAVRSFIQWVWVSL